MGDRWGCEWLRIWSDRVGSAHVLYVEGEVDLYTQSVLARELAKADGWDVIVDLAGCTHLSARGFDLLDDVAAYCAKRGRTLVVARIPPLLHRVFSLLSTSVRICTAQSVQEALQMVAQNSTERAWETCGAPGGQE